MNRQFIHRILATANDWSLPILRLAIGSVFIVHGWQKIGNGAEKVAGFFANSGIPLPLLSAHMAMWTEFLGGIALVLGLATRLAAIPLSFTMIVAFAFVHAKGGFTLPGGFEYVMVIFAALMVLARNGGGALAADSLIAKKFES